MYTKGLTRPAAEKFEDHHEMLPREKVLYSVEVSHLIFFSHFSLVIVVRFRVDYSFTTEGPRGKNAD